MLANTPKIESRMTTIRHTGEASAPIRDAKRLMLRYSVRHLPVVEQGKTIGIISDRDIKLNQAVSNCENFDEVRLVKDVCVVHPYSVHPTARADQVLEEMLKARIGSALIISGDKLLGIFTVTDACRALLNILRRKQGPSGGGNLHSELE